MERKSRHPATGAGEFHAFIRKKTFRADGPGKQPNFFALNIGFNIKRQSDRVRLAQSVGRLMPDYRF
jgi:hypothetical protein